LAKYGAAGKTLKLLTKRLEKMQRNEFEGNQKSIKHVQAEIHHLLEMKDTRWKQRVKRHWYKKGDRNTKFFHDWASQRRRANHIVAIRDEEGINWSKPEHIGEAFNRYF
jgi:hypothetical protein